MIPAVIISNKRDHKELTDSEIEFMIRGYAQGQIPDYQMSALAMAIFLNGMTEHEISTLTHSMIDSGNRLARVGNQPRVDKHSTGGLGDKTSLIMAPLLACCEFQVPMISGRALGITGGTLDKLESIDGYRTNLSEGEIEKQLNKIGCVITGATDSLVPADKKLYALRDVTATVPSIPLITASIMSKKIAENLDALVLDVKFGSGAFLPTLPQAEQLAQSLIRVGSHAGVATSALITDMTQPLGQMVGNACEVDESIEVLRGGGPRDVRDLSIELAARLLVSTNSEPMLDDARVRLSRLIDRGAAMDRFERMVWEQGGQLNSPRRLGTTHTVIASKSGFLQSVDGQLLGQAIIAMGGGRKVQTDRIDFSVGLKMLCRIGDAIEANQPWIEIFCSDASKREYAVKLVEQSIEIGESKPDVVPLWKDFAQRAW